MPRSTFINRPASAIIINRIAGHYFAQEFAYRITMPDNASTLTKGLDKMSTSINSDTTCQLEISYQPLSGTLDQIYNIWQQQVTGQGDLFTITINSDANENLSFHNCSLAKAPDIEGGGENMVARTATFNCEIFVPDQSLISEAQ